MKTTLHVTIAVDVVHETEAELRMAMADIAADPPWIRRSAHGHLGSYHAIGQSKAVRVERKGES